MKRFLSSLCCILFAGYLYAQTSIVLQPYLQSPAEDGITVMWRTAEPSYAWVEYGTDTSAVKIARTVDKGIVVANITDHKVRVEGLAPNQKYYYRVCSQKVLSFKAYKKEFAPAEKSPFYSFTTPGKHGTDFTCVIFNDLHSNLPVFDMLVKHLKGLRYDFAVFNGDCFADPLSEEHELSILKHYNAAMNAANIPSIFMRGNHEIRGAFATEWPRLVDWPSGRPYFAFSFGDTRFVFLDNGEDKNDKSIEYSGMIEFDRFREEQTAWLLSEIIRPEFKNAARRILIQHIPIYGWKNSYDPGFIPCRDLWDPIYRRVSFDINITGHLHRFAFYPTGKTENPFPLVIGGGNNEQSARVMILQKQGDKLTLKAIDTQGKAETFAL